MADFKPGDRVRIIGNGSEDEPRPLRHYFSIGALATVQGSPEEGVLRLSGPVAGEVLDQYVSVEHVERVEP